MNRTSWEYPIQLSDLIKQVESQIVDCKLAKTRRAIDKQNTEDVELRVKLSQELLLLSEHLREYNNWLSFLNAMQANSVMVTFIEIDQEDHTFFFKEIK